jgi:hypothetical protein
MQLFHALPVPAWLQAITTELKLELISGGLQMHVTLPCSTGFCMAPSAVGATRS